MLRNKQTLLYLSKVIREALRLLRKILCSMAYTIIFPREGKVSFYYQVYKRPLDCNSFSPV